MTKRGEADPRYHNPTLFAPRRAEQEIKGVFWLVCPKHGVRKAVGVIQWSEALSQEMQQDTDPKWFFNGRYTSGNCSKCGLTLSVTRGKPTVK